MAHNVQRINRAKLPCHYCTINAGVTTDHIVPVTLGGPSQMWNLVPACLACNMKKTDMWPDHDCPKCREAIRLFTSDPELSARAIYGVAGRLETINSNLASVSKQKRILARRRKDATKKLRRLERLVKMNQRRNRGLTPSQSSSIVEA